MLSLFGNTIEASKQVENKDIWLLLGKTDGKSTTIHFLTASDTNEFATRLQAGYNLQMDTLLDLISFSFI